MTHQYDAVVVGAGPNGFTAAITMARAGQSVLLIEGADTYGGGMRSAELTLPGYIHDICSAVHPLIATSPVMTSIPLADHGLSFSHPEVPLAHALDENRAVLLHRDIAQTAAGLGADEARYVRRLKWMTDAWPKLQSQVLGPLVRLPDHPITLGRFGLDAIRPATRSGFKTEAAQALFAGNAAHSFLPLERPLTASFGWFLMVGAHRFGWPVATGGSQQVAEALASYFRSLGGEIRTGTPISSLAELPSHRVALLDVTPSGFAKLAHDRLPARYLARTKRFRHGPAAFKLDYSLSAPVPWINPDLGRAGTVHIGGTAAEIAESERAAWVGRPNPRPFILAVQPSLFDRSRAPEGKHTLWVYGHVPNGTSIDFSEAIEQRLEWLAPGFKKVVLGRHVMTPADFESYNPNYVGGDIAGGAHNLSQLVFRPFPSTDPYATPIDGVFLCSSSTPPGAGTHGMCGFHAAQRALAWTSRR